MLEASLDESPLACPIVFVGALEILNKACRVSIQCSNLIRRAILELVLGTAPRPMQSPRKFEDVAHLPFVEAALQWEERRTRMRVRVVGEDTSPIVPRCQAIRVNTAARVLHLEYILHVVNVGRAFREGLMH